MVENKRPYLNNTILGENMKSKTIEISLSGTLYALLRSTLSPADLREMHNSFRTCGRGTINRVTFPVENWLVIVSRELDPSCFAKGKLPAKWQLLKDKIVSHLQGADDRDRAAAAEREALPLLPVHPRDCPEDLEVTWPLALYPDMEPLTFAFSEQLWTCVEHPQFTITVGVPGQEYIVNEEEVGPFAPGDFQAGVVCHHSIHATLAEAQAAVLERRAWQEVYAVLGDKPAVHAKPQLVGTDYSVVGLGPDISPDKVDACMQQRIWRVAHSVPRPGEWEFDHWANKDGAEVEPDVLVHALEGRWDTVLNLVRHLESLGYVRVGDEIGPAPKKPLPELVAFAARLRADLDLLDKAGLPGFSSLQAAMEKYGISCSTYEFRFFLRAVACGEDGWEAENFARFCGNPVWAGVDMVQAGNFHSAVTTLELMSDPDNYFIRDNDLEAWCPAEVHVYARAYSWGVSMEGDWLVDEGSTMMSQEEALAYLRHLQHRQVERQMEGEFLSYLEEDGFTQEAMEAWVRSNAPLPFSVSGTLRDAWKANPGALTRGYKALADELDAKWLGVPVSDIHHYARVISKLRRDLSEAGGAA